MSTEQFVVVMNAEEQYSIWPSGREIPNGWSAIDGPAPREQCLLEIERRWSDTRPRSLRDAMKAHSTDTR